MTCVRSTLSAFPLVLSAFAPAFAQQQAKVTITDEVYPQSDDGRIDRGSELWLLTRVVDGMTGAPIPEAELVLVAESSTPMRGEFQWSMRAKADADGFVRLRCDGDAPGYRHWNWIIVRAPGYGAAMMMDSLEHDVMALAPAIPLPIRVLDWRGRPVRGALVGFCGGCGHTPDLAWGRTNRDGLTMLTGVDPCAGICDLYLEHRDLALCHPEGAEADWFPGEAPQTLRIRPGVPSVGRVVDQSGAGIAGVFVGERSGFHRGPWTRTGNDGSFALFGADEPSDLIVRRGRQEVRFHRPRTQPFTLQLPQPNGEREQTVQLPDDERLPWTGPWRPDANGPRILVRAIGSSDDEQVGVRLCTADGVLWINDEIDRGVPVPLPKDPFTFELSGPSSSQRRVFHYTRAEAIAIAPLRLHGYGPTRIEGQVVDDEGQPHAAVIGLRSRRWHADLPTLESNDEYDATTSTQGAFSLACAQEGLSLLVIRDPDGDLPPRMIPLILPPRGDDAHIDVGTITLGRPPLLTAVDADGEPCSWAAAEFLRAGWNDVRDGRPSMQLDYDGAWIGPDPKAGDAVILRPPESEQHGFHDLPVRFVLEGDGPWLLRLPSGQLRLDVRDADGKAIENARAIIGEHGVDLGGLAVLRRLRPGSHRVFVAARDYRSAIVEVMVPETGTATATVTLPLR